ncbi:hypothetical protein JOL62DRAFT_222775 [Phyllosticta paracitricarpa]|uniref:Secreted protein n=1 Tax=Phyllosticta paracitricarpa TaxID=2016321 RepID=A0ABR1N2A4_9PEZI
MRGALRLVWSGLVWPAPSYVHRFPSALFSFFLSHQVESRRHGSDVISCVFAHLASPSCRIQSVCCRVSVYLASRGVTKPEN